MQTDFTNDLFRVSSRKCSCGFALLVTVTLISLLVLVLVGLATFVRIETQVAGNAQKRDTARHHALFALNIAIGQLQQHAGPDPRLTAQANLLDPQVANPWFTGVWTNDDESTPTLRTWLISGNETDPLRFGPNSPLGREVAASDIPHNLTDDDSAISDFNPVQLVSAATASSTGHGLSDGSVFVPSMPINVPEPDTATDRTIGRYAYWVGDQGVKASLVLPDRLSEITYPPWFEATAETSYDQRHRIRQQIATAPTFFRRLPAIETYGFDPLNAVNKTRLPHVLASAHYDLLKLASDTPQRDAFRRHHFHHLTDRTHAVLSNTLPLTAPHRGLQRDLSLAPDLLGPAFVAQSNLADYMEAPSAANTAVPPITSYDSPRRRYRISAVSTSPATSDDPEIEFKVAPVLNSLIIQFRFFRENGSGPQPLVVRSRLFTELWNPYSAAMVPETLHLEIEGLPTVTVKIGSHEASGTIDLASLPPHLRSASHPKVMLVKLPFTATAQADRQSWLPGRVYAWRTESGTTPPPELLFYNKASGVTGWTHPNTGLSLDQIPRLDEDGLPALSPGGNPLFDAEQIQLESSDPIVLTIRLKNQAGAILATYTTPALPDFAVENVNHSTSNWAFGLAFRLNQPSAFNLDRDWLTAAGRDPRKSQLQADGFVPFHENLGWEPTSYGGGFNPASDDMLNYIIFRRASTGTGLAALQSTRSANLDLPVFELPRLPYLSVGELQHLTLPESRPFSVGNSWGEPANSWFDRFFFSGLVPSTSGPDLIARQPLPNWNLQPLSPNLRDESALSSQHLLQAGGFNLNSALPEAWQAVLSGVRFSTDHAFSHAHIDNQSNMTIYTGSQPDPAEAPTPSISQVFLDTTLADNALTTDNPTGGPTFFRFPQSAQETYYWENTNIEGDFKKQPFRQGVRGGDQAVDGSLLQTLSTTQINQLANAITNRLREQASASGPFRSLQQFLAPNSAWSNRNLLEQAIHDAAINPATISPVSPVAELADVGFSSLTLTSGDIMTALAPYLRTRSDTFLIRTYGEALNAVTGQVEGRAWCEASVQRFPETLDEADDTAAPATDGLGRKFRITHFRWLSPSDI